MTVALTRLRQPGGFSKLVRGLEARLVLVSVLFALLVAAVFAALVLAVNGLRSATRSEAHAKDRTAVTLALENRVLEVQAAARGYVLSRNADFYRSWIDARAQLKGQLKAFPPLFTGRQRNTAKTLVDVIRAYVNDYSIPIVQLAQTQPGAARSSEAAGENRLRINDIRGRFERLLRTEDSVAARHTAAANSRSRRAIAVGIAGLAISALLIVLFGVFLARAIARPLRAAAAGASRVAGGDLATRLEESGPGEVGELTRAFNDMTSRLEESHEQLAQQNARLRESERLKAELISIVSHELRTPLASVLGFTNLLLDREIGDEDRRRYLGIIDSQSRRLETLVSDFLDAQRVEEGRLEMTFEPLDLAALVREQAQLFAGESHAHRIEIELTNEPFPVIGARDRLAQVVGNLLSNAIKYSPEGGLVEVTGSRNRSVIRVQVRDHGRGIPPAEQPRIFTKFFRGDAGASGIAGTGLGLALAREIVEAHGGRIGFRSRFGEGSTFWIELPTDAEVKEER